MRILFIAFLFIANSLFAQTHITGNISNSTGNILDEVNVLVYATASNIVVAFCISNTQGQYKIEITDTSNKFDIEVSHIGYTTERKSIYNRDQTLDFILKPGIIDLPTVIVEHSIPIVKKGDTLNYDVKTFASKTDRVIADVIKKLPGIEVDINGQVKYNGKAITNYYIENLDLLESKYNIANNNIPADMVDKVQVLENHQPIKALDSLVFSDRAAINIKLNNKAKDRFITTGKLGSGLSPFLWNAELLTFNFRKKFQFISGYKTNNTGDNLANELNNLIINAFDQLNSFTQKKDLLSLVTASPPSFREKRYLFNTSHILYSNGLVVIDKVAQLKYNLSYLNNKINREANQFTSYYLPHDTIVIREDQQQKIRNQQLLSDIGLTVNTPELFIKNNLKLEAYWYKGTGTILNINNTQQHLSNPLYQLINNAHFIWGRHKRKIEFNSNTVLKNMPQTLAVAPGPYTDILNQSLAYDKLEQKVEQRSFITDNYLSLRMKLLKFNPNFKVGINYEDSKINSSLNKYYNGQSIALADSFKNQLHWQQVKPYTQINFYLSKKSFKIDLTSTFSAIYLKRNDPGYIFPTVRNYLFSSNALNIKKEIGPYYIASLSFNNDVRINGVDQNTMGYMLTTYRNMSKNISFIEQNKNYTTSLFLNYRNAIKALFSNLSVTYNILNKNLLYNYFYAGQLEAKTAIPIHNQQKTFLTYFTISKYFNKSKINISVNGSFNKSNFEQLLQDEVAVINNNTIEGNIRISQKKLSWLYPELESRLTTSINKIASKSSERITSLVQTLNLNFFITSKIIFTPSVSYYKFFAKGDDDYLFADLSIIYKKAKHSLECKLNNLTNIRNFKNYFIQNNMMSLSSHQLRLMNVLLQYNFSF